MPRGRAGSNSQASNEPGIRVTSSAGSQYPAARYRCPNHARTCSGTACIDATMTAARPIDVTMTDATRPPRAPETGANTPISRKYPTATYSNVINS